MRDDKSLNRANGYGETVALEFVTSTYKQALCEHRTRKAYVTTGTSGYSR